MADFNFSVFSAASAADTGDADLIDVLTHALGEAPAPARWRTGRNGIWCSVSPEGGRQLAQGWKLHVSATPASAREVLRRTLPVLLEADSAFKFAATTDYVAALNARNTSRGHSGKFMTIYPGSDAEAVRLAGELDRVTAGLPGPRILSDRPYARESLVHYRYGAFVEERRMTNDGFYAWMILDPDGNPVEDRRVGRYTPPSWVTCPFPDNGMNVTRQSGGTGDEVLIGSRFAVREAIRHSNKGGVYRAVDAESGDPVVIKEARPHVAADHRGRDARDRLRSEFRALESIQSLALAPRPVRLFTQSGHLFLAQEMIPGNPLRDWTADLLGESGWGAHLASALGMARRLADLMIKAHAAGLVLRDFNPNNIMVRPDGTPVLIDLELAVTGDDPPEDAPTGMGTPAFGAPEQMEGAPPRVTADYYSLGATLCYVFTGGPPYFLDDRPPARPLADRLTEWLAARTHDLDLPTSVTTMLTGLMADEPDRRWTPARAREVLAQWNPVPHRGHREDHRAPDESEGASEPQWLREACEQAVEGITGYLLASMEPESARVLWPASCVHGAPDPCSLQHGAAGSLGALARCYQLTADPRLPEGIGVAARWIVKQLQEDTGRPPGLYFGTAGAAWALLEAGLALGDDGLVDDALAVAESLPSRAASPDVTHGTAGIGLTALHMWARTGRARFAERARAAADALVASAEERSGRLVWRTPADQDSKLAGKTYHGFAHGTAGVGYFLLAYAEASGHAGCRELALRVGDGLLDEALITPRSAMWGTGSGDAPTAPYWCHGSSGIASFLVRLGQATGAERFARAADLSARAVTDHAWRAVLGQCHGLSGNGDFLLDMASLTGDGRHRAAAWRLARIILAGRAHRDGHIVFPDEQGEISTTWGDGLSGILAFLARLRYGSPRLWMADAAHGAATSAAGTSGTGRTA
ncbi:class IV lanthionine synthetase LanL [Actinomadura macra]|uniref:class IV lanthionine synthetase LanL n=1 Tax=Actinomadura macra TaxID=46164 RepID=UPI00082CFFEA|nr:class IV lanthionine synthetase LanL [Actinomadura macra]